MEKEEQKKNKAKYTPIPNHTIPLQQAIIASPTALKKLVKGEYVLPWYWTPDGIESARLTFINSDTQTFTFVKDILGATSLTPTVSEKESNTVIPDSKLPFNDLPITIPHCARGGSLDSLMAWAQTRQEPKAKVWQCYLRQWLKWVLNDC